MTTKISILLALIVGIAIGVGGFALTSRNSASDASVESARAPNNSGQPAVASAPPGTNDVASPLPEIPISLNYVEAPSRNGYVVQFHNQSQKHLAVLVDLENKTLNQKKSGPLQFAPGQMIAIGGTSEWTFVSGETVTIKLDGHQTKEFQVP